MRLLPLISGYMFGVVLNVDLAAGRGFSLNGKMVVLQLGRVMRRSLQGLLERWGESRFSDTRAPNIGGLSRSALDALVPMELEKHLQRNSGRHSTFQAAREEVRLHLDTHRQPLPRPSSNQVLLEESLQGRR